MLPTGSPIVFGFRRKENREENSNDGEKTESELPQECHSRVPLFGSCIGATQIADVRGKDSIGQAAEKEKAATSEKIDFSDQQQPTKAQPMIGSSSSNNISSIVLGLEGGRVHTELDVKERDSNLFEQESDPLEEVYTGALGLPKSIKTSSDVEGFDAEVAGFKILDQRQKYLRAISGVARSSSASGFGKRKLEEDETESGFLDQDSVRITKLNKGSIFGFWWRAHDRKEREELESGLENRQGKKGNPAAPASAVAHPQGKQSRTEREEGSFSPIDTQAISLPDDLVEKTFGMIPYPGILITRMLNKSWNANFSASPDSLVFQNQVMAVSAKWKHYCPIILNIEQECLVGYDRVYNRWQTMPLRFEREGLSNWSNTLLRGAGSLICGVFKRRSIFVANIVTRTWKWLPSRPDRAHPKIIHIIPIGSKAYQVLLITKDDREPSQVSCELYDSRMQFWTIQRSTPSTKVSTHGSSVFLNGVLYVMEYDPDDVDGVMKLQSYNLSDRTWTNISHPFHYMLHEIETYKLLVCQNHVRVILHLRGSWWTASEGHNTCRNTLVVYKLDQDSLDIKEVARGPPESISATCSLFTSDNDCIYFGNPQVPSSSVLELNMQKRKWTCLPAPPSDGSFSNKWVTFAFQPGMNPFVSV